MGRVIYSLLLFNSVNFAHDPGSDNEISVDKGDIIHIIEEGVGGGDMYKVSLYN